MKEACIRLEYPSEYPLVSRTCQPEYPREYPWVAQPRAHPRMRTHSSRTHTHSGCACRPAHMRTQADAHASNTHGRANAHTRACAHAERARAHARACAHTRASVLRGVQQCPLGGWAGCILWHGILTIVRRRERDAGPTDESRYSALFSAVGL